MHVSYNRHMMASVRFLGPYGMQWNGEPHNMGVLFSPRLPLPWVNHQPPLISWPGSQSPAPRLHPPPPAHQPAPIPPHWNQTFIVKLLRSMLSGSIQKQFTAAILLCRFHLFFHRSFQVSLGSLHAISSQNSFTVVVGSHGVNLSDEPCLVPVERI